MKLPRVAVLRGGMSNEYEVSMKTGGSALRALANMGYPHKDVTITRSGEWLDGGRVRTPEQALTAVDVVFIALHGEHGEDGRVQRYLTNHQIPYTGSRALASATAFNKHFTKRLIESEGIKTPRSCVFRREDPVDDKGTLVSDDFLDDKFVLKPITSGSSIDIHVNITPAEVSMLVPKLLEKYDAVLLEQYISGKEVTVGVLEQFRDAAYYLLPAIEIEPPETDSFYSYDAKYGGQCTYHCPGRLSPQELDEVHQIAETVHRRLDLRHYSRSDFIVADDGVYFLEVNTLPGLTETSLFPKALTAVGANHEQLIAHLVANAHY